MAKQRIEQDTEFRKGVLVVVGLVIGAMILGATMHLVGQRYAAKEQPKGSETQYLSLGDQAAMVGENTVVLKLTVEYVGGETEAALKQAMPVLRRQVAKMMSQVDENDQRRLYTPQGKQELADSVRTVIQENLESKKSARNVKGVLFEKFLIRE